ncbi:MAG TPA: glycosyltransferase family 2 protein [Candidatus Limnocylindrales bacterium]
MGERDELRTDGDGAVLALIPAHDEAPRIGAVVRAAAAHLPVLVIDDGSSDDTAAVAEAAGAHVLVQRPNQGKGAALRAGFRWALAAGCDAVVTLDADGQHDPTEIPAFLAAWRGWGPAPRTAPLELVVGRRDFRRMPVARRLANTFGGLTLSLALGRQVPDNQSGYRLVGRALMTALLDSREPGFEFEVEMLATCLARGFGLAWVPIRTIYAGEPSHVRPLHHVAHFLRAAWAARRTVRGRPVESRESQDPG